jgi:uncharacterized protein YjbI with pentapeptide repeats
MTVEMVNVNLTGADLSGADIWETNLSDETLNRLARADVIFSETILPDGRIYTS